ncbi:MAG: hypothetical protein AAFY15_16405, partial [Cyanobacteria bacterium J06648_11]
MATALQCTFATAMPVKVRFLRRHADFLGSLKKGISARVEQRENVDRICKSLDEYVAEVEKMEGLYGRAQFVYVATDDPRVIQDLQARPDVHERFRFQQMDRDKYDTKSGRPNIDENPDIKGDA